MIYLFDLDGTLANIDHRLHWIKQSEPNWKMFFDACHEDEPIPHMVQLAQHLHSTGAQIYIVSGRSSDVRTKTKTWLINYEIPCHDLIMRFPSDRRPDHVIKLEWWESLSPGIRKEIVMAFEDRTAVVNMWRSHGVPCLQVAQGDF